MNLENLIDWREWQKSPAGTRIFPTRFSMGWFMRNHEKHLVEAGAMVKNRNVWHVIEPIFSETVFAILREQTLAEV